MGSRWKPSVGHDQRLQQLLDRRVRVKANPGPDRRWGAEQLHRRLEVACCALEPHLETLGWLLADAIRARGVLRDPAAREQYLPFTRDQPLHESRVVLPPLAFRHGTRPEFPGPVFASVGLFGVLAARRDVRA